MDPPPETEVGRERPALEEATVDTVAEKRRRELKVEPSKMGGCCVLTRWECNRMKQALEEDRYRLKDSWRALGCEEHLD